MGTEDFLPALRQFLGIANIVPAGRAALGIWAALRAWGGNGPVAVQSTVCQDVIAAILMTGRQPYFCDVAPETGLAPASEWLRARNDGADAAVVVHLYGNPADTHSVKAIFSDRLVIDDAAQALGTSTPFGLAGTGGDIGIISFGHTKHIEAGGAVLLSADASFAAACAKQLAQIDIAPDAEINAAQRNFRNGFDAARVRLRKTGEITGFVGLLAGHEPTLRVAWQSSWSARIAAGLAQYPAALSLRRAKAARWAEITNSLGFVPVGMNSHAAPWRFACRLPGCDWQRQHHLGELLRGQGLDLSHWYLPAHWLLSGSRTDLPGAEQLAQESFQFWIDGSIDMKAIENAAPLLERALSVTAP